MTAPTTLLTIGQLARRSGVPVRTIRFWSDEGVLPETDRSRGNYRRYDAHAVARLDLVRTLRELGMGLDDVRTVLARRRSVADVAAAHVHALDAQIRALRAQRAVCTLLARDDPSPRKAALMNDLTRLSAAERQQLIDEFVDAAFAGTDPRRARGGHRAAHAHPARRAARRPEHRAGGGVDRAGRAGPRPAFRARVREMAVAGSDPRRRPRRLGPAAVTEHAGPRPRRASTRPRRRPPRCWSGSCPPAPTAPSWRT
jgi:DNA-binding transcriptional MerR regulator